MTREDLIDMIAWDSGRFACPQYEGKCVFDCQKCAERLLDEYESKVKEDEREKVLNAVYECGWHCEVHSREALTEMVNEQLKEQGA